MEECQLLDSKGYFSEATIAALATAPGGPIAIIRVSGKDAFSILRQISCSSSQSVPGKLYREDLFHLGLDSKLQLIDQAMCVYFVGPHSFTGEDVVEYHVHGSSFIIETLLKELYRLGARQALPGEFSFRSVRNGKMNLFQAQAVVEVIHASTDQGLALALEKLSGQQNSFLKEISDSLMHLASSGEIGIDFSDQDIEELSLSRLKNLLKTKIEILKNLEASFTRGECIQEGIACALIGLPNAGKSSFFNLLLGEDRSIVTDLPGTTRDVIREKIRLESQNHAAITLRMDDTAGLRSTQNKVEKLGIQKTEKSIQAAALVLLIIHPTSSPQAVKKQWQSLMTLSPRLPSKTLGILTHRDKYPDAEIASMIEKFKSLEIQEWSSVSSVTSQGLPETIEKIVQMGLQFTFREKGELILTQLDHLQAVQEGLTHLHRAQEAPALELFASDIKQALRALSPLIGETVPDDILGHIFSHFCIGK